LADGGVPGEANQKQRERETDRTCPRKWKRVSLKQWLAGHQVKAFSNPFKTDH